MNYFPQVLLLFFAATLLCPIVSHAAPVSSENSQYKATPALSLSLNAVITMAIQNNIDLRIESQNSRMAIVDAIKSKGIYDPILNASGNMGASLVQDINSYSSKNMTSSAGITQYVPTGGNISLSTQTGFYKYEPSWPDTKDWQSSATLAFSQPLLKNAGPENFELNITLSATTQKDSLERFRSTTTDTVYNVITSYNRLYVLQRILKTREAALTSARAILAGVQNNDRALSQGIGIADAEYAIDQRTKEFFEATRSVEEQEVYLRYLIGLETTEKIIPTDPPSKREPQGTFEQAVATALESRPDMKQLKSSLESARLLERVAKHQSLPELTVNASGGVVGTGVNSGDSYRQLRDNPTKNWTVGMQFNVPLGNTAPGNEYVRSKIRSEQAEDQVKALSWRIRNEIKNDLNALVSARLQMYLAEKASRSAEQRYEQYRKNNQLNLATVQDVLNAENDMNNARNSQMEAVETFSNAVSRIGKDTGVLLDIHNVMIDVSQPIAITKKQEPLPAKVHVLPAADIQLQAVTSEMGKSASPGASVTTVPASVKLTASSVAVSQAVSAGKSAQAATPTGKSRAAAKNSAETAKTFTLMMGEFVDKQAMAEAVEKIKSIGLSTRVKEGSAKAEQVIRLHYADFSRRSQAESALKKLQQFTSEGFIMQNSKKRHVVFAGSYVEQSAALKAQAKLAGHGITVQVEKTALSLPATLLLAGNFLDREVAHNYLKKLEHLGLQPVIMENQ